MQRRLLGNTNTSVSAIGLGCMGMSEFYGPSDDSESLATLERALAIGVDFWDTADMYGSGANERLLSRLLATRRREVFLATKFGIRRGPGGTFDGIDGRPEYVAAACDASLARLGVETIDLYYQHRVDRSVPIEETVGAMARLVEAGKVRYLGLSEASAATLRRAHAVHPIAALQTEYSLWTREVEAEILPTCRELGITLVAYSPLGRGFLTGHYTSTETLADNDYRRSNPRFVGENLQSNVVLAERVRAIAAAKGLTPAQLALAWLLAQGPGVVPIPGTRKITRLEENAAAVAVELSAAEVQELRESLPPAAGTRYPAASMAVLDG